MHFVTATCVSFTLAHNKIITMVICLKESQKRNALLNNAFDK